ncbi:MAG TPA: hypothetical protein VFR94_07385 [Nitrososphaeraceae archaeon]|nr:hypothetical protein [Nitrososphaeraceae archaeon]
MSVRRKDIGLVILVVAALIIAPFVSSVAVANAQEQEQEDISVEEPRRQLTSQWWQWVLSIPPEDNPLLDTTGESCQEGDMGDVFFLVGTLGGSAERECTISEGQEILIPIFNSICFDLPGGFDPDLPGQFSRPRGPDSCEEQVESFIDQASNLELTIDGVSIENLEDFRVQSNPFPIRLPEDNIVGEGLPSRPFIGISDGYWAIVESLPEGEHTIEFGGQALGFTVDVTYHLTIE